MTELRASIAVILLLLACLMVIMNWSCAIASARNRRNRIQKHVSTVPLLSLIFAGFAQTVYPWTPKGWIGIIPVVDIGNWMLIVGLPWAIAKGMFKKGPPNHPSERTRRSRAARDTSTLNGVVGQRNNMIQIRYSPPNELDLSGSSSELQKIRQRLLALFAGTDSEIVERADQEADPKPYVMALTSLHARVTKGPTKVAVVGNEVVVDGAADGFKCFASYFDFPQNAVPFHHHHHEYYDGDQFIHKDSVPMVIGIQGKKDE